MPEEVSLCVEMDMYVGEGIVGYSGGKINNMGRYIGGERIIGKLVELLIVCPDDLHPGWMNVKAKIVRSTSEVTCKP